MTSDCCGFFVGINHVSPIDEYPDEKWDVMISIMLTSPFDLIKYFIPSMKQKGQYRLIVRLCCRDKHLSIFDNCIIYKYKNTEINIYFVGESIRYTGIWFPQK